MFINNTNWKRRLKRLGLVFLALIAVLLIINAGLNWWAGAKLEAKLAKLRAAGEPVCIADLGQPVPVNDNAALILLELHPELKRFEKEMVNFEERTPLGKQYAERSEKHNNALPNAEQAAAMETILDDFNDAFREIERAAACEQYVSLLDYSLDQQQFLELMLESRVYIRGVARIINWKVKVLVANGECDQAVRWEITLLKLARLYDEEPTVVNALIGIACRGIAAHGLNQALRVGPISAELRKQIDSELARHDDLNRFADILRTERPLNLDALESWKIAPVPINWHFTFWQSDLLDYYEQILPWTKLPWPEMQRNMEQIDESQYPVVVQLLFPAIQSAAESFHRSTATLRCLRILNAVGAHRDKHGEQPQKLSDLDLPASATIDPFTGKPLIFRHTDNGWLIYTVYQNGVDDGGDFSEQLDWGLAPLPTLDE